MEQRTRLIVLFGGQSPEHDVSCISARHILAAADPDRFDVVPVAIGRDGVWRTADEALSALADGPDALPDALLSTGSPIEPMTALTQPDGVQTVVFPAIHGPMGEDGTVQGLLELANIAYVGSGVLGSAVCMDKALAKELTAFHEIPQAAWRTVHFSEISDALVAEIEGDLGLPVYVKPANMGSSLGVSKAATLDELAEALDLAASYDEWIVVEENIDGHEIEVAVLGNHAPIASIPGEIVPGASFYTYEDKYRDGVAELHIPARLPDAVNEAIRSAAVKAYRALRCEGLARVDFFYDAKYDRILLNEINTMPGFTPISMYPKMWAATGIEYPDLISRLVDLAVARHDRRLAHRRTE